MKQLQLINNELAKSAMENNGFGEEILNAAPKVILVLTQSWCPDWLFQLRILKKLEERDDLLIFYLEYNKLPFAREFTSFKENCFHNGLIPYLRFYKNGEFEQESNFSSLKEIKTWIES